MDKDVKGRFIQEEEKEKENQEDQEEGLFKANAVN
jgi:hypothetical protein